MPEPCASTCRPLRIYTCTPVAFATNAAFFARDTGLIHTQLKSLGVESKCILGSPADPRDLPDPEGRVIRTTLRNMEDEQWWRALGLDGVYLYSWGAPRYRRIARAIHRAGIRLAIHFDTSSAPHYWDRRIPLPRRIPAALRNLAVDFLRSRHLNYADFVTTSAPALEGMERMFLYRSRRFRFREMPCPVAPHFTYDGTPKQARIIAVGRWDDVEVKRTRYLMELWKQLATRHAGVHLDVCGPLPDGMQAWYEALPVVSRERIHLHGSMPTQSLPPLYNRAQIVICTSHHESSHIASAEGLCCGCSAVCSNRPLLHTVKSYATTPGCGRLPAEDTPESMAEALVAELAAWERGERDPQAIAARWQPVFHCAGHLRDMFSIPEARA